MSDLTTTIAVDKQGIFKCPCDDEGAVHMPLEQGPILFRLGKYTFYPCQRCARQIEAVIMGNVMLQGAKLAIEANIRKQELAGRDPLGFLKGVTPKGGK